MNNGPNTQHDPQENQAQQRVTPPHDKPAYPDTTPPQQKEAEQNDARRKKVRVIGSIMIAFGILSIASGSFNGRQVGTGDVIFGVAQVLIGAGLLSFNRIAYSLFNIVAILAIIASIFYALSLPLTISVIQYSPSFMSVILSLVNILLGIGQLIFYIYGGIVFHDKDVRALFQKK